MKLTLKLNLAFLLFVILPGYARGQHSILKAWGGEDYDNNPGPVTSTYDNGFAAAYSTANFSGGGDDVGLQVNRFSPDGELRWTNHIRRSGAVMSPLAMMETADSSLVVVGEILSATEQLSMIIKLDSSGTVLWERAVKKGLFIEDEAVFRAVLEAANGDLIVCGNVFHNYRRCGYLVRLDANGNPLWSKILQYGEDLFFGAMTMSDDGDILLSGYYREAAYNSGFIVNRISGSGTLVWERKYRSAMDTLEFFPGRIAVTGQGIHLSGIVDHTGKDKSPVNPPLPLPDGFYAAFDLQGDPVNGYLIQAGWSGVITDVHFEGSYLYALAYADGIHFAMFDTTQMLSSAVLAWKFGAQNDESGRIFAGDNGMLISGTSRNSGKLNLRGEALGLVTVNKSSSFYPSSCYNNSDLGISMMPHAFQASSVSQAIDTGHNVKWLTSNYGFAAPFDTTYCTGLLGIQKPATDPSFAVYPNPYDASFAIDPGLDVNEEVLVEIYDATGRLQFRDSKRADSLKDLGTGLLKGVYFVQISLPDGSVRTIKVVKQ